MDRCEWAGNELMMEYHDKEWGVPLHDDRMLFEFLMLEGAQAGLSWNTILQKRENYRAAFDNFEPSVVAGYGDDKIQSLLADAGIVRNRLKIAATIGNAKAYLSVVEEFGSFDDYVWGLAGGTPLVNSWQSMSEIPGKTDVSDHMSNELKKRGFKFVGSTICYAFMQATGMVSDHRVGCFRYNQI
ncbi:MAG: DNA-3-methyladenine glycosylase I [SAR202 cluster bacterium]|nr:DNA-3-methyladenine glycosylase I [SAR202 cluster bacterium]HCP22925.1 DNA-3-methyladenine glycosylase I [Dehalococcoidia bacterium]